MPAPNQPAITLAFLKAQITARDDLPLQQRREVRSAINTFAKVSGRTPADIIADPATVRGLAARAPWQLAGLGKGYWANVLSRLTKGMALSGIKVRRQRRNFKLDPAWDEILAPMSRPRRDELHRFAGWCSVHGVAPSDVSAATFERYLAYLEEQTIQQNPRERCHVARRAWNKGVAAAPESPFLSIPAPEPIGRRALEWKDFPVSLRQEIDAYSDKMSVQDIFDERHRPIKPVTLRNYLTRLRVYLTCLVESGMPPNDLSSLAALLKPATVKRGLEHRLGGRPLDDRGRMDLHTIMVALLSIATYLKIDDPHHEELRRIARRVQHRPNGMNAKNKERLAPLSDRRIAQRLVALPVTISCELQRVTDPTVRQARRMQLACLLEILLHVPLRIRNAAELDLETSIIRPIGGRAGRWRISIAAEVVKNKVAIDAELGDETSALLNRFVSVFRPVLSKEATTALFVSQGGRPKGPSALSKQLTGFVRRETGLTIHAHLVRHFAAHLHLKANPGDYETVRRLLGHKSIGTTINSYAGTETAGAFACYGALIADLRPKEETRAASQVEQDLEAEDVL